MSRETIRQASVRLFSLKGYEGTSVKDIAEELSLTPPALYSHYKSKEELYLDALCNSLDRLSYGVKEAALHATPQCVHDILYNICNFVFTFYLNNKIETLFLLRSMMFPPSDIVGKSSSLTEAYFKEIRELTSVLFTSAISRNEIVPLSVNEHTYYFLEVITTIAFEVTALSINVTSEDLEKSWKRYWNSISATNSSLSL